MFKSIILLNIFEYKYVVEFVEFDQSFLIFILLKQNLTLFSDISWYISTRKYWKCSPMSTSSYIFLHVLRLFMKYIHEEKRVSYYLSVVVVSIGSYWLFFQFEFNFISFQNGDRPSQIHYLPIASFKIIQWTQKNLNKRLFKFFKSCFCVISCFCVLRCGSEQLIYLASCFW